MHEEVDSFQLAFCIQSALEAVLLNVLLQWEVDLVVAVDHMPPHISLDKWEV